MEKKVGKLVISMHIPKTRGTSLLREIQDGAMGRYLVDNERPGMGASFIRRKSSNAKQHILAMIRQRKLLQNYDVIHGHFPVRKYAFLYPRADFITFMREPVERVLSAYYYFKYVASKNPTNVLKNPYILLISENRMSLLEFASIESMKTTYARRIAGLPLNKFTFVGITEKYPESIMLLNRLLGTQLKVRHELNNNHSQYEYEYTPLLPELRALNRDNTRIYEEALGLFEQSLQAL